MAPVRIGCVRYLNTSPLIEGLEKLAHVELTLTVPARIADLVSTRQVDIGLCSVIDVARSSVPLALLPAGAIGCDGPTLTVRLFSRVPLDRVTTVHADAESHTSAVLCQLLLEKVHGVKPALVAYAPAFTGAAAGPSESAWSGEAAPETVLLIGDKVVVGGPSPDEYPHQMDLGQSWKELTGLPFVYAAWMCRASEVDAPAIRAAAAVLDRQRRHNATRMDWIVRRRAAAHGWPARLARRYLVDLLRFAVGERERSAVDLFLGMAADAGLAPRREAAWAV
jgi:chorismate dehydratase